MNGHQYDYNHKLPNQPVAVDFNTPGHTFNNLTVMVIQQLGSTTAAHRKHRESYWIHNLQSMAPYGLNLNDWKTLLVPIGKIEEEVKLIFKDNF